MCWAIITGHFGMAEHFWQEGGNSIGNALFASALCVVFQWLLLVLVFVVRSKALCDRRN
jgi:hypothetical protein